MKRSPELIPLSQDHHHALVAARALRRAGQEDRPLEPILEEFLRQWEETIAPHFRLEEEVLLPAFADRAGADHPMIRKTLVDHVRIRSLLRTGLTSSESLSTFSDMLEAHIHFEERELFPLIEEMLAGEALVELGQEIETR